eukprot:gene7718-615_t
MCDDQHTSVSHAAAHCVRDKCVACVGGEVVAEMYFHLPVE